MTSFKKPHSISQVMHLRKSSAVFWSIVCIFSCVYVCSYTSTCGYYTFPFAVTAQDAMRTVSWGSVYWNSPNSPIELFLLMTKPQRCNNLPPSLCQALSLSLSLCPLCMYHDSVHVFWGGNSGSQKAWALYDWVVSLSLIPHWNVCIIFSCWM